MCPNFFIFSGLRWVGNLDGKGVGEIPKKQVIDVFPKIFPVKLKAKNTDEIYRLSVKRTSRSPSFWKIALDRYAHEFASPKTNQEIKFFKKPGKDHSENNVPHQFQNSPNDLEIGS